MLRFIQKQKKEIDELKARLQQRQEAMDLRDETLNELHKFTQTMAKKMATTASASRPVVSSAVISARIIQIRQLDCCTQKCCSSLPDTCPEMLNYQIAKWDNMSRKQKSKEAFYYMLAQRVKNRREIEIARTTGVRMNKSGDTRTLFDRERQATENKRIQYTLWDPSQGKDVSVCVRALGAITGTFGGSLRRDICAELDQGNETYYRDIEFARDARVGTKTATVIGWVSMKIQEIGDAMPHQEGKVWLPYDSWAVAYHHYSLEVREGLWEEWGVLEPASLTLFQKIVNKRFSGNVKFAKKYNTFTKCNTCSDFKIQLKRHGYHSASGKVWFKHYCRHLLWQAKCRMKYHYHRDKAKSRPDKYMSIILDGSDNHSFEIPFCGDKRKDFSALNRPKTRSTGVLCHTDVRTPGVGGLRLYITDERTKKGTNFNLTCLFHTLVAERQARGGKLPPYLYLQLDSAGDNKSKTMARTMEFLVKQGIFLKIKVCFLPVGHTHEDIDAGFGRLNRKFTESGTVTATTQDGLNRAKQATAATRDLVWIKVCPVICFSDV